MFTNCSKLTNLTCEPTNPYFSAFGGCLYNKDKTVLLYAPAVEGSGRNFLSLVRNSFHFLRGII